MKTILALALCVAVANAGVFGGSSGGSSGGWEQQASSGWQQQQQHSAPQQQEQKIIIVKQQGGHSGSTGGSLTVAGPTHVIKTVHQVRTIDQGGRILSKSGGGTSGQQAKVLVVKEVKTAQVQRAPQQQHGGWAPQQQQGGWSAQNSGGW